MTERWFALVDFRYSSDAVGHIRMRPDALTLCRGL
jgi:hypothetical protein